MVFDTANLQITMEKVIPQNEAFKNINEYSVIAVDLILSHYSDNCVTPQDIGSRILRYYIRSSDSDEPVITMTCSNRSFRTGMT